MHEPLEAKLRRLEQERADADRRYNDALTAFDQALVSEPALPREPAEYDEQQLPALNDTWKWVEKELTLVTIPKAGHFVHRDAPQAVNRALLRWLAP